jgi:hypothetical protein
MPPSQHSHQQQNYQHPVHPSAQSSKRKLMDRSSRTVRIEFFVLAVLCALLLAAASLYLATGNGTQSEFNLVNKDKYQAVFLNGGVSSFGTVESAYFGKITSINSKYLVLENIYFAPANQDNKALASSGQLAKLGCSQVHAPYDRMVINKNEVSFWENLQDSGKVVQAINKYQKANPHGPNCSGQTTSTSGNR